MVPRGLPLLPMQDRSYFTMRLHRLRTESRLGSDYLLSKKTQVLISTLIIYIRI